MITPGSSFLRRVISLLSVAKRRHHHIRLNSEFKADLAWWHVFAAHWNGSSLLVSKESPQTTLTSDASGQWGCGAWHNTQWFQLARDQRTQDWHIAAKELIPIVIAAVIWGEQLKGKRVLAQCDNTAVVAVLNTRYAKDVVLMRILRCLFVVQAHFQFSLTLTHIPGVHNVLADDLSRNMLPSFQVTCQMLIVPPFPVSESILRYFAAHLATKGLSPQTIKTYLAGIQHMQIVLGLPEPRAFSSLSRL